MSDADDSAAPPELRARALAVLGTPPPTRTAGLLTMHELRVHQIELELQNEELRRVQNELEAARQRWFELYDLAPVGYCTLSESGLILQSNLAAAELLGLPRAQLAKQRFSPFVAPADRPTYFGLHARLIETGLPQACELRMCAAGDGERWVQLNATAAMPDAEGVRSLRIVLVDVTVRRQAEAAEAALRLSEESHRSRSQFLSRVSHEFRTPLNAILGFAHLLAAERATMTSRSRRQLDHIVNAGTHLLHMVDDLLDVSRAGTGGLALRVATVDLQAALEDAVQDVAGQAQSAGVTLALCPDEAAVAAPAVRADPTRLRQVMQNLLTNAIKYNRAGGHVVVRIAREGTYWRVHVADDGLGMTLDQQGALFEPFNRLGRESGVIEGTGLGLVIARDLVRAMGGQLSLRSEAGRGTELQVDLLAVDDPAHGRRTQAEVTGRVLCVDDDPASCELVQGILAQRPGLALETVGTGLACIAAARRAWPDLLLLDLGLPDMPGLDVLKVLQQLNPHLPMHCLVLSAEGLPHGPTDHRTAGVEDQLLKPIDADRLLSTIDRLMDKG